MYEVMFQNFVMTERGKETRLRASTSTAARGWLRLTCLGGGGCSSSGMSPVRQWRRRRRAGGGGGGRVFYVFSQDKVLQRLVEQIFGDFSASGTRFHSALRGAEPHGVGLVVPFSDVSVFRTASLGTWTLFLRACD